MAASLHEATGAKTSAVAREGRPYEEICDAAKTLGADLIALTTHGYTGLKHAWLGSTAERVSPQRNLSGAGRAGNAVPRMREADAECRGRLG